MPGAVFLEGDRIELRTVEERDIDFLQTGMNHPEIRPYAGADTQSNRRRFEEERFQRLADDDVMHLLVWHGSERLGDVSLAPIDERRGWANLGYWIHPDHQGHGDATEAARLVIAHGFDVLRLHRISATIVADNEASKRVVEKPGFVHEGTKRDDAYLAGEHVNCEVYAALSDEWTG